MKREKSFFSENLSTQVCKKKIMIHHRDFLNFKGNKFDGIIAPIHQRFVEGILEIFIGKCKKSFIHLPMAKVKKSTMSGGIKDIYCQCSV